MFNGDLCKYCPSCLSCFLLFYTLYSICYSAMIRSTPARWEGRGEAMVTNDTNVYCCPVHHTQSQTFKSPGFLSFLFTLRIILACAALLSALSCIHARPGSRSRGRAVSRDKSFPRLAEDPDQDQVHFTRLLTKEMQKPVLLRVRVGQLDDNWPGPPAVVLLREIFAILF